MQFLMELQKHKFLILKGHSKVNCPKDFMPDVLSTFFCDAGLKGPNFIKKLCSFLEPISPRTLYMYPKRKFNLQIARIFKLFKCLNSFCVSRDIFSSLSRMLTRKNVKC